MFGALGGDGWEKLGFLLNLTGKSRHAFLLEKLLQPTRELASFLPHQLKHR